MTEPRVQRRLAAIMAADIVGYSRLIEADEAGTLARVKALRAELFHPKVSQYGGRIVKTTGDGTLVEFPSAVEAVSHALDVQAEMARRNADVPEASQIMLRIGINVGDIVVEDDDIHGDGVNVAARLEGLADPNGVCISGAAYDHVAGKIEAAFDDLGPQTVKNISRPIRVLRVRAAEATSITQPTGGQTPAEPLPLPDHPSIAVLPFQNMSGDAEQEFFADGVTEDIITDLSKVSGMFVIGRHSSFVYKGRSVGLRQVGHELGVRYVLEGSVRKAGNRVRITAQLIDASTDNHVWAERFDRDLEDIFAVQEEVARNVVEALAVTLRPEEDDKLGGVPTKNLEAYDAYLRGRRSFVPPTPENLARARRLFERAIELDPAFAGGYAGLSLVESVSVIFRIVPNTPEVAARAMELADKAVAMDADFALSHAVKGWAAWISGHRDVAIEMARQAIRLQPGDPDYHAWLSNFLTCMGRAREAIAHAEHAVRLNPKTPGVAIHFLAYAHAMAGNSRTAIDIIDRILPSTYSQNTYAMLILAHAQEGNLPRATEAAQLALQRYPDMTTGIFASGGYTDHDATRRAIEALRTAGIPDEA